MKALSIRQPWAFLIAAGHKDIENRTWHSRFVGQFKIHAGAGMTRREYEACKLFCARINPKITLPAMSTLLRGGIVGQARIVSCVTDSESPWFVGPVGFVIADAKELPFQPLTGTLGFFEV